MLVLMRDVKRHACVLVLILPAHMFHHQNRLGILHRQHLLEDIGYTHASGLLAYHISRALGI